MPAFAAKTKRAEPVAPAPAPKRDLGADIENLRAALMAYLDERVAAAKQTRDGSGLPPDVIKHHLAHGETCLCKIVDRLLNE